MDDQELDYHNFSTSPAHRLPTLTGTQALEDAVIKHKPITTSLVSLDSTIYNSSEALSADGGILRGSVTEVYGPPGSGKSTFAMQLVVNSLKYDGPSAKVTWVDTTSSIHLPRLARIAQGHHRGRAQHSGNDQSEAGDHERTIVEQALVNDDNFTHVQTPSLPLLAVFASDPHNAFLPEGTTLLVVDNLSSLTTAGLPGRHSSTGLPTPSPAREEVLSRGLNSRRASIVGALSSFFHKIAVSRNIAVVILNQVGTSRKSGNKTVLRSMMASKAWDSNITTRIALCRRFWPKLDISSMSKREQRKWITRTKLPLRVAEVERLSGRNVVTSGVRFVILKGGLRYVEGLPEDEVSLPAFPSSSAPQSGSEADDAMQEMGLADVDQDAGLQMPEDEPSLTSGQLVPNGRENLLKRKLADVLDDDDDVRDDSSADVEPALVSTALKAFFPSSQLKHDTDNEESDGLLPRQSDRDAVLDELEKELGEEDEEEMLLDKYEGQSL